MISARWLNYHGRLDDAVGSVMGPNTFGELVTVTEQTYDETTDRTRLGFVFGVNAELVKARIERMKR